MSICPKLVSLAMTATIGTVGLLLLTVVCCIALLVRVIACCLDTAFCLTPEVQTPTTLETPHVTVKESKKIVKVHKFLQI